MMPPRRTYVYGVLAAIWLVLIGWQTAEYMRQKEFHRANRIKDAKNMSSTFGIVMRSLQRGGGVVLAERLNSALNDLVDQGGLRSVLLLNATNGLVAEAGTRVEPNLRDRLVKEEIAGGVYWDDATETVTLMNLVDLGTNIVIPANELFSTNRFSQRGGTNVPSGESNTPPTIPNVTSRPPDNDGTNLAAAGDGTNSIRGTNATGRGRRGGNRLRLTPEMIQNKGVHNFIIAMPTSEMLETRRRDFWLRAVIGVLATISVVGSAMSLRNLDKSAELQIRLVRASELNSHLKEMNLAAAGLAHETRNPLNIVRGLAQMISKRDDASPEVRDKSREIVEETDRVTAQLNEFINYSRPREVRPAATNVSSVVAEVARALGYDLEEKKIAFQNQVDSLIVEADEQLLRQALFNLVLNAIQAVPSAGDIQVRAGREGNSEGFVEVVDNGPGVSPDNRGEIFKPYFTTHQKGTGLGLAVVQQIVLAHGWEIEYLPNQPAGAIFRIRHLKLNSRV